MNRMTIYFTHPHLLWSAAALGVALWLGWRRSALDFSTARTAVLSILRATIVLAIIMALAGLTLGVASNRREAIFLIDSNASIDDGAALKVDEFIEDVTSLDASVKTKKLYFASRVVNEASELLETERNESDLQTALLTALAASDPTRATQVVLFSDGVETTGDAAKAANENGIRISTSPLPPSDKPETQVAEIIVPQHVSEVEPFRVETVVRSSVETVGKISFYQNGNMILRREAALSVGENRFKCDAVSQSRAKEIEISVRLESAKDTFVDNNVASTIVVAEGKPGILIIANEPANLRNFAAALKSQDIQAETRPVEGLPDDVVSLDAFDAVVFSDVSAVDLTLRQMETIRSYVRDFGGGFLALGGDSSFGLGGYAKTPLDDILPLRSDFEKEKEKPSLAISLVIDRSGSMEG
ncbi:MAG: BatA domain-containing protein, partial [Thermoguttaceae bacterium]|nr:BatA domain-containing protein [Thermoguttaceae bacterium]